MRSSRSSHKEHTTPQPGRPAHTHLTHHHYATLHTIDRYRCQHAGCMLGLPCSAALSLSCPAHTGLALAVGMTQIGTGNLRWLAG